MTRPLVQEYEWTLTGSLADHATEMLSREKTERGVEVACRGPFVWRLVARARRSTPFGRQPLAVKFEQESAEGGDWHKRASIVKCNHF